MNVISQDAYAKIAVNKSLLKEYSSSKYQRVVYLNDGDEFQIQLFNPEKYPIAAKIHLNGEELSDMLVLRPGERIWLERYLDQARKFKFSTYEIEDSYEAKEAASLNGEVKVQFYRVKTPRQNRVINISSPISTISSPISIYYNAINGGSYQEKDFSEPVSPSVPNVVNLASSDMSKETCYASSYSSDTGYNFYASSTAVEPEPSIETGRVEQGGYSNQKFSYVNYDFEDWPFRTETISILPLSRKPVTASDLKKKYCSNCGRKLSPKHKFCPYCGTKVE